MAGIPGQGRKFDTNIALDQAADLFWRYGYEGTSIAALTKAMKITPPSLYAAFGGKEEVFYSAVDRYSQTAGNFMARAFDEEPRSTELVRRLLNEAAEHYADETTPRGCLIINAATCVNPANQRIADYAAGLRTANINRLTDHIQQDIDGGRLPESADPAEIAHFVGTVIQGMAQRGRDGASTVELRRTAELTMQLVDPLVRGTN